MLPCAFSCYIACLPPPTYIYCEQYSVIFGQLRSTLAAGNDEYAMAAAHAATRVFQSAGCSRPVDYDLRFFESLIAPLEEHAKNGTYRINYEAGGVCCYMAGPTVVPYKEFHNRRWLLSRSSCDHCGSNGQRGSGTAPVVLSHCSRCSAVLYCSRECQVGHWKFHKQVCKKLAALKEPYAAAGWRPSPDKDMCGCGFGPVSSADLDQHVALTGHLADLALQFQRQQEHKERAARSALNSMKMRG